MQLIFCWLILCPQLFWFKRRRGYLRGKRTRTGQRQRWPERPGPCAQSPRRRDVGRPALLSRRALSSGWPLGVMSGLFLLEQNKEVCALFSRGENGLFIVSWLHAVHWGEVARRLCKRPRFSFEPFQKGCVPAAKQYKVAWRRTRVTKLQILWPLFAPALDHLVSQWQFA